LAVVLVIRPLAGWASLLRSPLQRGERWAVAFFGIRGVGSVYYLAHALNETDFTDAELLWAVTAFVILVSVLVHGVSAAPVLRRIDARRQHAQGASGTDAPNVTERGHV
jgi:NhaP-type Na+/H+ or K+/H+ antiporter